jgi:transposase InsO family protein
VYGIRKLWRQLLREGRSVGRDRVQRLMLDLGISSVVRGKGKRTTWPAPVSARPADSVHLGGRVFAAAEKPPPRAVQSLRYPSAADGLLKCVLYELTLPLTMV